MMLKAIALIFFVVIETECVNAHDDMAGYDVAPWPVDSLCRMPEYPKMARRAGVSGSAFMQLFVDTTGEVTDFRVASCEPQQIGFEQALMAACTTWTFSPGMYQGKKIAVWVTIPFEFQVEAARADSLPIISKRDAEAARIFADSIATLHMNDPKFEYLPPPIKKLNEFIRLGPANICPSPPAPPSRQGRQGR